MFLSNTNPNRKSFSLNLTIPLSRTPSSTRLPKDYSSLNWSAASPSRDRFPSPNSPLLPATFKHKQEQPVLPVSGDSLDPSERMKLLKKTRKLSRILGEVPIPVSMADHTVDMRLAGLLETPSSSASIISATSTSPLITTSGKQDMHPLKRSATVGHNRFVNQSDIQRTRSLASIRASLTLPSPAVTKVFGDTDCASSPAGLPALPASPVSPSDSSMHTIGPSRRNSVISVKSRRGSDASMLLFQERTPEQIQRARAAKLARQLGENIPPELLLRASSPVSRVPSASPSLMSFTEASTEMQNAQSTIRRSSSTRRVPRERGQHKRRLSLDVRTLHSSESKTELPMLSETAKPRVLLKKSRSIGKNNRPSTAGAVDDLKRRALLIQDSDVTSDMEDGWERPLTSEQQRTLNVKRARKMNQLFGNDPPPALFQITNLHQGEADETVSVKLSFTDRRRDSRATFMSMSPSKLEDEDGRRDSLSSSGENLSPLVFAEPSSAVPSALPTPVPHDIHRGDTEWDVSSLTDMRPMSPISLALTSPSLQSISAGSTLSMSTQAHQHAPEKESLEPPSRSTFRPMSPPPLSSMFRRGSSSAPTSPPSAFIPLASPVSPSGSASEASMSPSDPVFRMRRIRAAKLSRFFGVGLHDIAGVLVNNSSTPSVATVPDSRATSPVRVPPVPPLHMSPKTESAETIPTPSSPVSMRPLAASGLPADELDVEVDSSNRSCKSLGKSSSKGSIHRTRSASQNARKAQAQAQSPLQSPTDRSRSISEPEVPSVQAHNRTYSTTVEVPAESKSRYFFRESRRPRETKELEMQAAIKQLRKIK